MSRAIALENLTVESLKNINKYFGISFDVEDGKITGGRIEGGGIQPTRNISRENLQRFLRKQGFNC